MAFEYLTNIPLEKAREDYISALKENGFGADSETISVINSSGRIISSPVYATICAPHYPASAMDGIVLKASYPAYKDQKWKEIKELLLKKFDIEMISLSTFLNPEFGVADSVVTAIYEITEKRK